MVLGTPIVGETNAQTLAKNFEFNVLGELVHELKIVPVDVARLQQASSTVVHQQIMELVGVLNGQAVVFRKIINLLKSTIQQSSTLAVVGSLQRITVY